MAEATTRSVSAAETAVDNNTDADLVIDEELVEEVSIDGMCGVY